MNIDCNLYAQWIAAIRQEMTRTGFDDSGLNDQECAIAWQGWKRRTVLPAKRTISPSSGFTCPASLQQGLTDLEKAFAAGAEVWPWQSKLIDRLGFEDGLYNDYRVVHFHLGVGYHSSGYINRTGELLFAIVDSKSVYEIGIYQHKDWFELDILDIIDLNWPQLLDSVTINGLDVAGCPTTRDEVKALRAANVTTIMKLRSGRIIGPLGGGLTTAGTSLESVQSADYWAKLLRNGDKLICNSISDDVHRGNLQSKDYKVLLHATDSEIAGVVEGIGKWVLWQKT